MVSRLGRSNGGLSCRESFSNLIQIEFPSFEEKGHILGAMLRKTIPKRTSGTGSATSSPATLLIPVMIRNVETLGASHERASPGFGSITPSRPRLPVRTKDHQGMVASVEGNGIGFTRKLKGKASLALFEMRLMKIPRFTAADEPELST